MFAPKHRLWVLVRTALARQFYHVPTIYVLSINMKNMIKILLKIFNFHIFRKICISHGRIFVMFQSFNEYFSAEHSRLLSLWRAVVAFRRNFSELKTATERDLSHVRGDLTKTARSMQSACLNLNANLRNADTESQVSFM